MNSMIFLNKYEFFLEFSYNFKILDFDIILMLRNWSFDHLETSWEQYEILRRKHQKFITFEPIKKFMWIKNNLEFISNEIKSLLEFLIFFLQIFVISRSRYWNSYRIKLSVGNIRVIHPYHFLNEPDTHSFIDLKFMANLNKYAKILVV